jgi:hypothetical protein
MLLLVFIHYDEHVINFQILILKRVFQFNPFAIFICVFCIVNVFMLSFEIFLVFGQLLLGCQVYTQLES